ncbi:MAG TPA: hypothetical protein PK685_03575 [archaeon]|nr:hypothetical protein [archaeon]
MKKNIYFCKLILILLVLFVPNIFADFIPEGYKSIKYCIKFNNLSDYQDYGLFAVCDTTIPTTYLLNDPDGCYGMYKFCNFKVCVIEKNKVPITLLDTNYRTQISKSDRQWLNSNMSDNNFICKDLNYHPMITVKEENPIVKVVDVMALPNFRDSASNFQKVKIIYTYTNGISEEIPYTNESRPISKYAASEEIKNSIIPIEITSNSLAKNRYFVVIISLIAIIIISIILIIRKNKKKNL